MPLTLEKLIPGTLVEGLDAIGPVEVLNTDWYTTDAVQVAYRTPTGPRERLVFRDDEATLRQVSTGRVFAFDGDGHLLRLASEALRIRLAHLFDPYLAVHTSRIDALPHQITAVYDAMLPRQPLRFLLADDPGAGKTIMAGLLIKELMIRGDLERCLIVAPGSLVEQWQDELSDKFGLDFGLVTRDGVEGSASGNPFEEKDLLVMRLDMAARSEELQAKIAAAKEWDLVVCDEAHRMSASYYGSEVKFTRRFQLGRALGSKARNFLLMTATPHNGKEADFQLFMSLLDSDRFEGKFRDGVHTVDAGDLMRRLTKEELRRFDGTPLFPERRAYTAKFELSSAELALYESVTRYVREGMDRAERILAGDDKRKGNVGFALQILQRRLASSPAAIHESLRRRLKRLEAREAEIRVLASTDQVARLAANQGPTVDDDDLDEAPDDESEAIENAVLDQATAARSLAELAAEIVELRDLEAVAARLRRSGEDAKWRELEQILDHPLLSPEGGRQRKLLIFTESRDTLLYLADRIGRRIGRPDAVKVLHGGIVRQDRKATIGAFNDDPEVRFLIANDAAGEGVNLQRGAHLMVNYDLPWNPNRLEQRFGRIHRIGQTEVCHLWNLIAAGTREGEVLGRLLEKIEEARRALGGRVYDVLGTVVEARALRDMLVEAIRYGERPDVRARLFEAIDMAADRTRIEALVAERKLTHEGMDGAALAAVRAEMERAQARRLQPRYIRAFFEEAFRHLGGQLRRREEGRFEIVRVPPILRARDRAGGRGEPVQERYARICFDKEAIGGEPQALLVAPGHRLLDATLGLVLERHGVEMKRGAILVDPADRGISPRVLFYLEHALRDGRADPGGTPRHVSRRLQFVSMGEDGTARDGGWAPYLDYRPATKEEIERVRPLLDSPWLAQGVERRAMAFAIETLVPRHLEEVRSRRLREVDRVEAEVRARLRREINYWDSRASELEHDAVAGQGGDRGLNSQQARRRAEELQSRLARRTDELSREREIVALPPVVHGGALVLPQGLVDRLASEAGVLPEEYAPGVLMDVANDADVEAAAMVATMATERALGRNPRDVSAQKCGYDIESLDPASGSLLFIEVKGRREGGRTVIVTKNELLRAANVPEAFVLSIVLIGEGGFAHAPVYVRGFVEREPAFAETAVVFDLNRLLERGAAPQ